MSENRTSQNLTLSEPFPPKFSHPEVTAKGEPRAWIAPLRLETLWFNTGTLCNLQCTHCYIESSPKNDRLTYVTTDEVKAFLDESHHENMGVKTLGFTGGEPFMNPYMMEILKLSLSRGFDALVLSNGMKPMIKKYDSLLKLKELYGPHLQIRISLDHYLEKKHATERGDKSWKLTLQTLQWLSEKEFHCSVAGRSLWGESEESIRQGYQTLFSQYNININPFHPQSLVLLPEMDETAEVPEITTHCWDILKIKPDDMMCATSRMVVKRKGAEKPSVVACTLIPYDLRFEMGNSLRESWKPIPLNHIHCAKFCVLGGGSCSG